MFNILSLIVVVLCLTELSLANYGSITSLNCDSVRGGSSRPFCQWTITAPDNWKSLGYNASNKRHIQWNGAEHGPTIYVDAIQLYEPGSTWSKHSNYLTSPSVEAKSMDVPWCFNFHYYINGEGVGNLSLKFEQNNQEQTLWTRVGHAGDTWHNQKLEIEAQLKDFQLKFEAIPGSGAIALGSTQVTSYQCGMPGSFECSFESNDCNRTLSMMDKSGTGDGPVEFSWKRIEAGLSESSTKDDHTTQSQFGHLLQAHGGTKGDYCEIASQPIKPLNSDTYTDDHCLKFWYRFENSSLVKLQVILSNETTSSREVIDLLWTSTSQLPSKMWHIGKTHFRLDRHETQSKRIWIKATNLGGESALVQLDDFVLNRKPSWTCFTPIDCNFDEDMCGWNREVNEEFKWEHGIGRVYNAKVLPSNITVAPYDVTEQKVHSPYQQGMYMYTDFTTKNNTEKSTVVMYSEFINDISSESKLYFQYIPLVFNDPRNKFSINLMDVQGNLIKTLFTMGATKPSSEWIFKTVEIKVSINKLLRIAFQVETYSPQTYLAIDEIFFL